jgi:predicted AAA+ superfamily ATPase
MEEKKSAFKLLIREFHESRFPDVIKRDLEIPAGDAVPPRKALTITGPRRAGKTFFFYQIMHDLEKAIGRERILFINFEDDRILPLSVKDLDALLEAYFELYPENKDRRIGLFFDEIQNVPGWEAFVRRVLDKENAWIYITGSSAKLLGRELSTALRGRTLSYPLSFREVLRFRGVAAEPGFEHGRDRFAVKKLLGEFLVHGGFPEIVLAPENLRAKILQEYFDLMIYRDLVERYGVRNVAFLKMLMRYLLANVSNVFSIHAYFKAIRSEMPVSRDTVMEYLGFLEEVELVSLLPVFSYSLKTQQVNPRKVYTLDNGLRNAVSFRFSPDEGRLAENLVHGRLRRAGAECYYRRGKRQDRDLGINVTFGDAVAAREVEGLQELQAGEGKRPTELVIITKDTSKIEDGIRYVPLWKWLLEEA